MHQSQYLPWPPYFRKLANVNCFVLLDAVQFQKNGVQNRNRIRNREGAFWLTVPVTGKMTDKIVDKPLAGNGWKKKHWKSIQAAYGRARYWSVYAGRLESLYRRDYATLDGVNSAFLAFFLDVLEIDTPVVRLSSLGVTGAKSELVLNVCEAVGASTYVSGEGGAAYLDRDAFSRAGISLVFEVARPPEYRQQHPGFIAGLSMLDMLMNLGKSAVRDYLYGQE